MEGHNCLAEELKSFCDDVRFGSLVWQLRATALIPDLLPQVRFLSVACLSCPPCILYPNLCDI